MRSKATGCRPRARATRGTLLATFLIWLFMAGVAFVGQSTWLSQLKIVNPAALWVTVLIGLASLLTEQRTKEVGIRKVLGASPSGLMALLSGKFFATVLAANVVAAPLAYLATRAFLGLFVYRAPFDGLALLAAGVVTLVIALAAVGAQVLRTARVNPVDCLRYE